MLAAPLDAVFALVPEVKGLDKSVHRSFSLAAASRQAINRDSEM